MHTESQTHIVKGKAMIHSQQSILWRDTSAETSPFKPLDKNLPVDLLVIGGGFTGNAAALEAASRGAAVCGLEAEILDHGGSGRMSGSSTQAYGCPRIP